MSGSEELNDWARETEVSGASSPNGDDVRNLRAWPRKDFEAPIILFIENCEARGTLKNVSVGEAIVSIEVRIDSPIDGLSLAKETQVRVDIPWLAVIGGVGKIVRMTTKDDGPSIAICFDNSSGEISQRTIDQILRRSAQ